MMTTSLRRSVLGFIGAGIFSFLAVSAVLAVGNGATNGKDSACCGYTGNDNPDGLQGSYAYLNGTHDLILSEWVEPSHDWVRNRYMWWTQTAKDYLNANSSTKAIDWEIRIHDQYYYNFVNNFNTSLPYTKAPENENWLEELAQGYTEVDMEQDVPSRISAETHYFWDQQFDSEKSATSTKPDFYSEVEWCNKSYTSCNYDVTGWMRKVVLQQ